MGTQQHQRAYPGSRHQCTHAGVCHRVPAHNRAVPRLEAWPGVGCRGGGGTPRHDKGKCSTHNWSSKKNPETCERPRGRAMPRQLPVCGRQQQTGGRMCTGGAKACCQAGRRVKGGGGGGGARKEQGARSKEHGGTGGPAVAHVGVGASVGAEEVVVHEPCVRA